MTLQQANLLGYKVGMSGQPRLPYRVLHNNRLIGSSRSIRGALQLIADTEEYRKLKLTGALDSYELS